MVATFAQILGHDCLRDSPKAVAFRFRQVRSFSLREYSDQEQWQFLAGVEGDCPIATTLTLASPGEPDLTTSACAGYFNARGGVTGQEVEEAVNLAFSHAGLLRRPHESVSQGDGVHC